MLIKALCDYYDVLAEKGLVVPEGYSAVPIKYKIVLTPEGKIDKIISCQKTEIQVQKNGKEKEAFFPAETEDDEDNPDNGLVILKVIHEDGEDLLSTLDSDEELDAVYDLFMENLFDDEE